MGKITRTRPGGYEGVRIQSYMVTYANPHASFTGLNNHSKCQVLILLILVAEEQKIQGLTLPQLAKHSSVSYDYLKQRLPKWCKWKYLTRRPIAQDSSRPVYLYSIAERGKHILNDVLPWERYEEIKDELVRMPANKEWLGHLPVAEIEDDVEDNTKLDKVKDTKNNPPVVGPGPDTAIRYDENEFKDVYVCFSVANKYFYYFDAKGQLIEHTKLLPGSIVMSEKDARECIKQVLSGKISKQYYDYMKTHKPTIN